MTPLQAAIHVAWIALQKAAVLSTWTTDFTETGIHLSLAQSYVRDAMILQKMDDPWADKKDTTNGL